MMIMELADQGNLRNVLSKNFKNILWKDKLYILNNIIRDLKNLHKLGYIHNDFHSGNILQTRNSNNKTNISYSMFQILDYLDQSMKKIQIIKYMEYYHILLQKF
jgi:serine/threonine protein kinase